MCHLRDVCGAELPKAIVFETGANKWHRYDAWPPKAGDGTHDLPQHR